MGTQTDNDEAYLKKAIENYLDENDYGILWNYEEVFRKHGMLKEAKICHDRGVRLYHLEEARCGLL